jgi:hypothetical protein
MHDGMLLSEVLLYASLLQKLETRHAPQYNPENLSFTAWEERWNHLLCKPLSPLRQCVLHRLIAYKALPTASMLKVGFFSASLVLTVRYLQELDEDLSSNTLLSDRDHPSCGSRDESAIYNHQKSARDEATAKLRAAACSHAVVILQTFLQVPANVKNSVGSNRCLCLVYSAMVLGHYGEPDSRVQDRISLDLISRLNQWLDGDCSKLWVVRLANIAQRKIMARIAGEQQRQAAVGEEPGTEGATGQLQNISETGQEYAGLPLGVTMEANRPPSLQAASTPLGGLSVPAHGVQEQYAEWGTFPIMEDFFSGRFLEFGFMDR